MLLSRSKLDGCNHLLNALSSPLGLVGAILAAIAVRLFDNYCVIDIIAFPFGLV